MTVLLAGCNIRGLVAIIEIGQPAPPTYSHQKHLQASSPKNETSFWKLNKMFYGTGWNYQIEVVNRSGEKVAKSSVLCWTSFRPPTSKFLPHCNNLPLSCVLVCFVKKENGAWWVIFALVPNLFPQVIKSRQVKQTQGHRLETGHSQQTLKVKSFEAKLTLTYRGF